jgi:deazaflavin-dependent oxidoreductase (nitroreductase family)
MAALDHKTEETLRQAFKRFNPFMVLLWRLGMGWQVNIWPKVGGRIMVITHIGRKSGLRRQTPVNYAVVDGEIYCTAGFGHASDWYRNMLAHPEVEVWLPDSRWMGVVEDISDDERRIPLLRQVIIASGIVAPLMGIDPGKLSDAEFDLITTGYKLVRIRPTRPVSGPGGPGDLAWVWIPASVLLGLSIFLLGRRSARAGACCEPRRVSSATRKKNLFERQK